MRTGRFTEVVWKKNIGKVLHIDREAQPVFSMHTSAMTARSCVSGSSVTALRSAVFSALNDLAVRGYRAQEVELYILLPPGAEEMFLRAMAEETAEICETAGIGQIIMDGELNPVVRLPVIFVEAVGEAVFDKTAEPSANQAEEKAGTKESGAGQTILLLGSAGLDGALQLLDEKRGELSKRFVPTFLKQAEALERELYAAPWIELARATGAGAMRQIKGGGILAALWELAEEAKLGFEIEMSGIGIAQETVEICEYFRLNPYQMSSVGSVLMLTRNPDRLLAALRGAGARAGKLGITTEARARVILGQSERRYLDRPAPDELLLWRERELLDK